MFLPLAAIPAIIGAAQTIGGLIGRATTKRPKYKIPEEIKAATSLAALRTTQETPGATQARSDMNILAANAIAGAQATGGVQSQLGSIVGAQRNQLRDLTAANEQYQTAMMDRYQSALATMAQYKDQEFQLNEMAPFKDRARLTEDIAGAGVQNLFNSLVMNPNMLDFFGKGEGGPGSADMGAQSAGMGNLQIPEADVDVDFGAMPDVNFGLQKVALLRAMRNQSRIRPSFYEPMYQQINRQYIY